MQLMRSWLVGMPGEHVSCVGCHEDRAETLPPRQSLATCVLRAVDAVVRAGTAVRLRQRGLSGARRQYCIGCHDGKPEVGPRSKPSFNGPDVAYDTLHPYVHRPGSKATSPCSIRWSTTPPPARCPDAREGPPRRPPRRPAARPASDLYCWIDLNVPKHGSFGPPPPEGTLPEGRRELSTLFAGNEADPERGMPAACRGPQERRRVAYVPPSEPADEPPKPDASGRGFPFDRADRRRAAATSPAGRAARPWSSAQASR